MKLFKYILIMLIVISEKNKIISYLYSVCPYMLRVQTKIEQMSKAVSTKYFENFVFFSEISQVCLILAFTRSVTYNISNYIPVIIYSMVHINQKYSILFLHVITQVILKHQTQWFWELGQLK